MVHKLNKQKEKKKDTTIISCEQLLLGHEAAALEGPVEDAPINSTESQKLIQVWPESPLLNCVPCIHEKENVNNLYSCHDLPRSRDRGLEVAAL